MRNPAIGDRVVTNNLEWGVIESVGHADELLNRVRSIAIALPDPCEGSRGHLAMEAFHDFETDLRYLKTDPTSDILKWDDGSYLTMNELIRDMTTWIKDHS